MMVLLLIAGIGFLLAGVLTIGFGIPVKEFSFGNTLILTGTVAACTGIIMLGLWTVVRELRNIARRLGPGVATEDEGLLFSPDQRQCGAVGAIAAMARGRRFAWRARRYAVRARTGRGRDSCQAAAQSAVLVIVAEGTRARRGACHRAIRT